MTDTLAVLDPARVQALRDLAGPDMPDIAEEVVMLFIRGTTESIERMKQAAAAGDASAVRGEAHSIKGSAGNVGAQVVEAQSLVLERAAAGGDPSAGAVHELETALEAAFAALRAEFGL